MRKRAIIVASFIGIACLASTYAYAEGLFEGLFSTPSYAVGGNTSTITSTGSLNDTVKAITAKAPSLNPEALKLGLQAYSKVREEGRDQKQLLTIVDYSKPSTEPRLWVIDLKDNKVLFHEYVAHGKNSGDNEATSFSDRPGSLKSSIGVFLTANPYYGQHGYSLRVQGLERGFNDNALSRAIVFHAAAYVSSDFAQSYGRLGKSWGCFAVNPSVADSLINTIKGGTVVFAYYPDKHYLSSSQFLS